MKQSDSDTAASTHGNLYLLHSLNMVAWWQFNSRIKGKFRGGEEGSGRTLETPGHSLLGFPSLPGIETLKGSWEEWFPSSQNVTNLFTYLFLHFLAASPEPLFGSVFSMFLV